MDSLKQFYVKILFYFDVINFLLVAAVAIGSTSIIATITLFNWLLNSVNGDTFMIKKSI